MPFNWDKFIHGNTENEDSPTPVSGPSSGAFDWSRYLSGQGGGKSAVEPDVAPPVSAPPSAPEEGLGDKIWSGGKWALKKMGQFFESGARDVSQLAEAGGSIVGDIAGGNLPKAKDVWALTPQGFVVNTLKNTYNAAAGNDENRKALDQTYREVMAENPDESGPDIMAKKDIRTVFRTSGLALVGAVGESLDKLGLWHGATDKLVEALGGEAGIEQMMWEDAINPINLIGAESGSMVNTALYAGIKGAKLPAKLVAKIAKIAKIPDINMPRIGEALGEMSNAKKALAALAKAKRLQLGQDKALSDVEVALWKGSDEGRVVDTPSAKLGDPAISSSPMEKLPPPRYKQEDVAAMAKFRAKMGDRERAVLEPKSPESPYGKFTISQQADVAKAEAQADQPALRIDREIEGEPGAYVKRHNVVTRMTPEELAAKKIKISEISGVDITKPPSRPAVLQPVYHGGRLDKTTEKPLLHVGSKEAAIYVGGREPDDSRIYSAIVDINHPVGMKDSVRSHTGLTMLEDIRNYAQNHDSGSWTQKGLDELDILIEQLKKVNQDILATMKATPEEMRTHELMMEQRAATFLKKYGFDSVQYTNRVEDKGSVSYILLDGPSQLKKNFNYDPEEFADKFRDKPGPHDLTVISIPETIPAGQKVGRDAAKALGIPVDSEMLSDTGIAEQSLFSIHITPATNSQDFAHEIWHVFGIRYGVESARAIAHGVEAIMVAAADATQIFFDKHLAASPRKLRAVINAANYARKQARARITETAIQKAVHNELGGSLYLLAKDVYNTSDINETHLIDPYGYSYGATLAELHSISPHSQFAELFRWAGEYYMAGTNKTVTARIESDPILHNIFAAAIEEWATTTGTHPLLKEIGAYDNVMRLYNENKLHRTAGWKFGDDPLNYFGDADTKYAVELKKQALGIDAEADILRSEKAVEPPPARPAVLEAKATTPGEKIVKYNEDAVNKILLNAIDAIAHERGELGGAEITAIRGYGWAPKFAFGTTAKDREKMTIAFKSLATHFSHIGEASRAAWRMLAQPIKEGSVFNRFTEASMTLWKPMAQFLSDATALVSDTIIPYAIKQAVWTQSGDYAPLAVIKVLKAIKQRLAISVFQRTNELEHIIPRTWYREMQTTMKNSDLWRYHATTGHLPWTSDEAMGVTLRGHFFRGTKFGIDDDLFPTWTKEVRYRMRNILNAAKGKLNDTEKKLVADMFRAHPDPDIAKFADVADPLTGAHILHGVMLDDSLPMPVWMKDKELIAAIEDVRHARRHYEQAYTTFNEYRDAAVAHGRELGDTTYSKMKKRMPYPDVDPVKQVESLGLSLLEKLLKAQTGGEVIPVSKYNEDVRKIAKAINPGFAIRTMYEDLIEQRLQYTIGKEFSADKSMFRKVGVDKEIPNGWVPIRSDYAKYYGNATHMHPAVAQWVNGGSEWKQNFFFQLINFIQIPVRNMRTIYNPIGQINNRLWAIMMWANETGRFILDPATWIDGYKLWKSYRKQKADLLTIPQHEWSLEKGSLAEFTMLGGADWHLGSDPQWAGLKERRMIEAGAAMGLTPKKKGRIMGFLEKGKNYLQDMYVGADEWGSYIQYHDLVLKHNVPALVAIKQSRSAIVDIADAGKAWTWATHTGMAMFAPWRMESIPAVLRQATRNPMAMANGIALSSVASIVTSYLLFGYNPTLPFSGREVERNAPFVPRKLQKAGLDLAGTSQKRVLYGNFDDIFNPYSVVSSFFRAGPAGVARTLTGGPGEFALQILENRNQFGKPLWDEALMSTPEGKAIVRGKVAGLAFDYFLGPMARVGRRVAGDLAAGKTKLGESPSAVANMAEVLLGLRLYQFEKEKTLKSNKNQTAYDIGQLEEMNKTLRNKDMYYMRREGISVSDIPDLIAANKKRIAELKGERHTYYEAGRQP